MFGAFDGWRVLPIRSPEEAAQGRIGGESEQCPHGIARSRSNPNVIYWSHDIGGVWVSRDNGATWNTRLNKGLWLQFGHSIEVDPSNPDVVLIKVDNSYLYQSQAIAKAGIYRSTDGGEHFSFVLAHKDYSNDRTYHHNITWDPSTIGSGGASRWYAAFSENSSHADSTGLYRSDDGGVTWSRVSPAGAPLWGLVYALYVHPTNPQILFAATSKGFFRSNDMGATFTRTGNLPAGEVSSIALHETDASTLYVTVRNVGLFRSQNNGDSFTSIGSFSKATRVFINYAFPDTLYVASSDRTNIYSSHDAGATWTLAIRNQNAPGFGRDEGTWKGVVAGDGTGIVPNPLDPNDAVAFGHCTIWRTTNGGTQFFDSSTLFTGFAWGWAGGGTAFDLSNPDRFSFFNMDVTYTTTSNRGQWFNAYAEDVQSWADQYHYISWYNMLAGAFQPNTQRVVGSAGDYWSRLLAYSDDGGANWSIADRSRLENHFWIGFHPVLTNEVYAGSAYSTNAGTTFTHVPALTSVNALMFGACKTNPDILYAFSKNGNGSILRSNDRARTWSVYSSPGWALMLHDSLPTVAVDPYDCDVVYSIDATGDLARFDGTTWTSLGVLPQAGSGGSINFVRGVTADAHQQNNGQTILYASMFASGGPQFFRSTDGGQNWTDISYNFPRILGTLSVSPVTGEVFVGSGAGTHVIPPPYESQNLVYDSPFVRSKPSCFDGLQNGDEGSVDCGGSCSQSCQPCSTSSPCPQGICCNGYCALAACGVNRSCLLGQSCSNPDTCTAACINTACAEGPILSPCYCANQFRTSGMCCMGQFSIKPVCGNGVACAANQSCQNPDTCTASCTNTPCQSNAQCTASSVCCNGYCTSPICQNDANCSDTNAFNIDQCVNSGTCSAACIHLPAGSCVADANCSAAGKCCNGICSIPACSSDADCTDSNSDNQDACLNPSQCNASCTHSALCPNPSYACFAAADCDDADICSTDVCDTTVLCSSVCRHLPIVGCLPPEPKKPSLKVTIPSRIVAGSDFEVHVSDSNQYSVTEALVGYGDSNQWTDEDGNAVVTARAGVYRLVVSKTGFATATLFFFPSKTADSPPIGFPNPVSKQTLQLEVVSSTLTEAVLRITDSNQAPIPTAVVVYEGNHLEADENGLVHLPLGSSRMIQISAEGYATVSRFLLLPPPLKPSAGSPTENEIPTNNLPAIVPGVLVLLIIAAFIFFRFRSSSAE